MWSISVLWFENLGELHLREHRVTLRLEGLEERELPTVSPFGWAGINSAVLNSLSSPSRTAVLNITTTQIAQTPLVPQGPHAVAGIVGEHTEAVHPLNIPRKYSHVRVAQLAYIGTPIGEIEQRLLRESVDVVIPHPVYLKQLEAIAPQTPKLIYTNYSNVYENLLTDWLRFADTHQLNREAIFYHVNRPTPFSGDSGSSRPVAWFWEVLRGNEQVGWRDVTTAASKGNESVAFADFGQSLVIGFPEKFREIHLDLLSRGTGNWGTILEYATATDAAGRPTSWRPLNLLQDGTWSLTRSGTMTFDPPRDWRPASMDGSDYLYFVRFRTTGVGVPAIARSITGRDYVQARGRTTGVIPAFDTLADRDQDGYLNDAEYARRRTGFDARFVYESRAFFAAYGQMRFATNPAAAELHRWAPDFTARFLAQYPEADGIFLDNSFGRLPLDASTLIESTANYGNNIAALAAAVNRRIAPKWILANISGSGVNAEPYAQAGISLIDEFALRPLTHHWQNLLDVNDWLQRRLQLLGSRGVVILDTHTPNQSWNDPRVSLTSLAYYYLLADPHRTMVMFQGGQSPNTSWNQHWLDAVRFNIGQPRGGFTVMASGADPADRRLTYQVFGRHYDNALVLYKPLSYTRGVGTGTTANNTFTTHSLGGRYRLLNSNGSLGPVITSLSLRNGEGAILVRA